MCICDPGVLAVSWKAEAGEFSGVQRQGSLACAAADDKGERMDRHSVAVVAAGSSHRYGSKDNESKCGEGKAFLF